VVEGTSTDAARTVLLACELVERGSVAAPR